MADFHGTLSSTSFRVKDREAWLADPDVKALQAHVKTEQGFFQDLGVEDDRPGYWAFGWYGQYPSWVLTYTNDDEETDEDLEIDIAKVIRRHILPGDVCQIGVSGNEKLRYIGGFMCWITSLGIAYFDATIAWGTVIAPGELRVTALKLQQKLAKITKAQPQKRKSA